MISQEDREAIEKVNQRFSQGVRQGNATIVASVYTDDAFLLPPNSPPIQGRPGIEDYWRKAIDMGGVKGVRLTTVELLGSEYYNIIQELGNYVLKIQPIGLPTEDRGKYVVVWKRTADGWKYHWDIWNTSMPP